MYLGVCCSIVSERNIPGVALRRGASDGKCVPTDSGAGIRAAAGIIIRRKIIWGTAYDSYDDWRRFH